MEGEAGPRDCWHFHSPPLVSGKEIPSQSMTEPILMPGGILDLMLKKVRSDDPGSCDVLNFKAQQH